MISRRDLPKFDSNNRLFIKGVERPEKEQIAFGAGWMFAMHKVEELLTENGLLEAEVDPKQLELFTGGERYHGI